MPKKISDLTDGTPLTGEELVEISRDGASYSAPVAALYSVQQTISIEVDYCATSEVGVPNPSDVNEISAITKGATTTVQTATPHGYTVNRVAVFVGVEGMTEINGLRGKVTTVNSTTEFVCNIDSSSFSNYTSGGTTYRQPRFDGADAFDGCTVLLPVQLHDYVENGVYTWSEADNTLTRHPAMADGAVIAAPYYIAVRDEDIESEESGDDNAGTIYALEQAAATVGEDEITFALDSGGGSIAGPNYFLAGPAMASARPNISRLRPMSTMDLPMIGVSGGTSGYHKISTPQLMQKAPRLSSYVRFREPWHDQGAFNYAQEIHREFVVDCMTQFRSKPDFLPGRRIIFEGTGFDGPVRILTYSANLDVFDVSGTSDLWLDGFLVFEALIPNTSDTGAIYANATFSNLRLGKVWSRGFSHAMLIDTAHEGFICEEVNVYDTATETGFSGTSATGSSSSVLVRNLSIPRYQSISADAAQTLKVHDNSPLIDFTGVFTANRTMTLSTENVTRDATLLVKVSGSHAYYANVGGLANVYTGQSCIVAWDGVAGAWKIMQSPAAGDVTGPASSTSGNLASWNGTGGDVLADSGVAASAVVTLTGSQALTNKTYNGLTVTSTTGTLTIANGSTLATSGAYSTTLTATGATNVTLPTTGTLATLAGSESLTNKTVNGLTITSSTGTLTVTNGKTLSVSNSLTLAGTDSTTMTFPASTTTVAGLGIEQTFSVPQTINVTDAADPALKVVQQGAGAYLSVQTNAGANGFTVDGSLNAYLGNSTTAYVVPGVTTAPRWQHLGGSLDTSAHSLVNWSSTTTNFSQLLFSKSRGSEPTHTVVTADGGLGLIGWAGSDGTAFIQAASIAAEVDGTPGTNDMPGRLVFKTTADGAASVTERLRIGSTGALTATSASATALTLGPNGATNPVLTVDASTASQAAGLKITGATSAGTVALAVLSSGAAANLSLDAKGTGTITVGGTSTGNITLSRATGVTGTLTVTSASATSATIGPNGATNPVLQVDGSTASQAAGLKVTGATSAGTVAIAVISSGTNANVSFDAKGSGTVTIAGTSTGAITLSRATGVTGALTVTSASSTSATIGPNGATNPVLQIDSSTASQAAGLKVTGATSAGTVALAVISSGTNANASLDAKGSGTVTIAGTSTGNIVLGRDATGLAFTGTGLLTALSGTAVGAGANTQAFVKASSTSNLGSYYGTGDPSFTAAQGSTYVKTNASTPYDRLWVNTSGSTTWMPYMPAAYSYFLAGQLIGANMNSTADQAITINLPPGVTRWRPVICTASNPSTSLTTCQGTFYTAAAKGGVAAGTSTTSWSGLTTSAADTSGSAINCALTNWIIEMSVTTIYLSLTTPQGGAATCDITLHALALP